MSILDFAENPAYEIVAAAFSKDDVVIIVNVKSERAIQSLETAIVFLQHELDLLKQAHVMPSVLPAVTPTEKCNAEPSAAEA